ncbi:DUF6326 family protein [Crocinitomix algicola]|uniref:DUF6326 family protein n=1 Tax=Crocinitomix algicola TaxID=1740263 RepID=UPI0009F5BE79|nr:DUF6326 family protein [Crocinitomix algicola]
MKFKKSIAIGLSLTLLNIASFGQVDVLKVDLKKSLNHDKPDNILKFNPLVPSSKLSVFSEEKTILSPLKNKNKNILIEEKESQEFSIPISNHPDLNFRLPQDETLPFLKNRRNLYSSMWAFASLNYLYADLVGLMDANIHAQYEAGVVEGTKITPNFLTVAAGFMQIPIANVFLPHIIKNEKTLRWIQIASGTVMTLVQTGTLFVGKPTPHYALFSAFEIAATTYITIDAIRWKPKAKKRTI